MTAFFTAARAFIATYETYFWLGLCAFSLALGAYGENVWHGYQENEQHQAEVAALVKQKEDADTLNKTLTGQHEADAKIIATQADTIQNLKDNLDASYEKTPANTAVCIAPVRVQLLNSERAAANSLRRR